jgi:uncharacterized RDD family membrane protein YckC
MRCPKCKLENPPTAARCDCGYDFASGQMRASYATPAASAAGPLDVRSIAKGYKANNIVGQRWAALFVDLFVFIVVFGTLSVALKTHDDLPFILGALFIPVYFVVLEGKWGVTLGKLAAKLRVVKEDGSAPGYWKALVRMLLRLVEVNPIVAGGIPAGIIVALSQHRQRLGDMLAGTYVLNAVDVSRLRAH